MDFRINLFEAIRVASSLKGPVFRMSSCRRTLICPIWWMIASIVLLSSLALFLRKVAVRHLTTNVETPFANTLSLFMIFSNTIAIFMISLSISSFLFMLISTWWLEWFVFIFSKALITTFYILWSWIVRLGIFNLRWIINWLWLLQLDNLLSKLYARALIKVLIILRCINATQLLNTLVFTAISTSTLLWTIFDFNLSNIYLFKLRSFTRLMCIVLLTSTIFDL